MSRRLVTLCGPLHWFSKRQRITALSRYEAKIFANDECIKNILHLRNVIQDLNLEEVHLNAKAKIHNDNMACVIVCAPSKEEKPQYAKNPTYCWENKSG